MPSRETGERRALWVVRIAGTAMLLVALPLLALFPAAPVERNPTGFLSPVTGFELAASPEDVLGILGRPDAPARAATVRRMRWGNRLDYAFMLAYAGLYAGLALLLAARGAIGRGRTATLLALAALMALGDALENRELLALGDLVEPAAMAPHLAALRIFSIAKFAAIYGASALVALPLWQARGWWRWSALGYAAGALIGATALVHLPAVELGLLPLIVAWTMTYVHALRAR